MKAIVWSKRDCPYCEKAKGILKLKGIDIEERKIGDGWSKEELLEAVPTARSVPQVFLDGKLIGGYKELEEHLYDQA